MKYTILVVDNFFDYRTSLKNGLKLAGFQVLEASSRREAIDHLESKPDLAIVDVRLIDDKDPDDFTGFQLIPDLNGLPVVILTAHPTENAHRMSYNLPPGTPRPLDFIDKTNDIASISARVQKVLNNLPRKNQARRWLRRGGFIIAVALILFAFYRFLGQDMPTGIISSLVASALIFVLQKYVR